MKKFLVTVFFISVALAVCAKEVHIDASSTREAPRTLFEITDGVALEFSDSGSDTWTAPFTVPFGWANRQVMVRIGDAEWNITRSVEEGANDLIVHADAMPQDATIFSPPTIRIRDVYTTTTRIADHYQTQIGVVVKTDALNPKQCRILLDLVRPDGSVAFYDKRDIELSMRGEDTLRFITNIPDSMLWRPGKPILFTLRLNNRIEGRIAETVETPVGFRTVEMRHKNLYVNGEPFSGLSELPSEYVMPIPIDTSAEGPSRERGGNSSNDPTQLAKFLTPVRRTYYTTQLDPSVLVYSLTEADSANGINLYESYLLLKSLSGERPVIYPWAGGEWNTD